MKQVVIKSGGAQVVEVPAPSIDKKSILVSVDYSCISAGTEMKSVQLSGMPLYKRALKQPENVKKVIQSLKDTGFQATLSKVRGKLEFGSPSGYSAAGRVIDVGSDVQDFQIGDRVACAGAGIANHAEIICVPALLTVKIPKNLDCLRASTVTLGAIALQGVRRFNPTLGETVVVLGLGILGILTLQLLKANGCRVVAIDLNPKRLEMARQLGADLLINPLEGDYENKVRQFTQDQGADGVIITAASTSSDLIHQSALATRRKGRIVLVGDVGLNLRREDFYQKEIDFLISCSYGPGRYDPYYELEGQDYPFPYVRWTENRNMQAYLQLMDQQKIQLPTDCIYEIDDISKAYAALNAGEDSPLSTFVSYSRSDQDRLEKVIPLRAHDLSESAFKVSGDIQIGIVGASSFVQSVHLPNLKQIKNCHIRAVMSRTGTAASALGQQYQSAYVTTDYEELLADDTINLILISTRHNQHGNQVLRALQAGKHVFVEKPLAVTTQELDKIRHFYQAQKTKNLPLLMTGFNRRFSPIMTKLKKEIEKHQTPLIINYQMNAGFISKDHWIQGSEGAGRNIGEACHIYDLFSFLIDSPVISVTAKSIHPQSSQWLANDNFVATIQYENGSLATLLYTSQGSKACSKERLDLYVDGCVYTMDDYKTLDRYEEKKVSLFSSSSIDKGHREEINSFISYLKNQDAQRKIPISLEDQVSVTQISLKVEEQLR